MSTVRTYRSTQLIALACAVLLLAGCASGASPEATPSPSAAASTPSADAGPRELPIAQATPLIAGSYTLSSSFPVGISFQIPAFEAPARWIACSPSAVEQAVCYGSTPDTVVALTFQIVDNVVADPCSPQETAELLDPPVGPSVDDLVAAISGLEGYEATAPVDITVDGFQGKEFTLTAPETEGCGATWATRQRTTGMGPGEINLLRILDVDGTRILISGAYGPETPEADHDLLMQVMDSVQIQAQ